MGFNSAFKGLMTSELLQLSNENAMEFYFILSIRVIHKKKISMF